MTGSYDTRRRAVLTRARRRRALRAAAVLALWPLHAWAQPASEPITVRLQIRVFNGTEDVTRETRLQLFPRGQRQTAVPLALGPDQAYEATVEVGFYDIQAIREQGGQVAEIRWIEQVLVQRYPDEYGRHLQVVNFRPEYGALQIRPAQDAPATRGWSGAALTAGEPPREVARARAVGTDLLIVVPAATYDIRITMPDQRLHWVRGIEVPADRTRLKTWTPTP